MLGIHLVERILDGDIEAIIIALTPFALANGKGLYALVGLIYLSSQKWGRML